MVEKAHTSGFWPSLYEPIRQTGSRVAEWLAPASEAAASKDTYRIMIELPGVAEKDIDLSVEGGVVSLKGEKQIEREEKGETWFFSERQYGAFSRSFRLPPDAEPDKVDARLKDGVLTITIPKAVSRPTQGAKVAIRKG
jgi:HSP20 family protein